MSPATIAVVLVLVLAAVGVVGNWLGQPSWPPAAKLAVFGVLLAAAGTRTYVQLTHSSGSGKSDGSASGGAQIGKAIPSGTSTPQHAIPAVSPTRPTATKTPHTASTTEQWTFPHDNHRDDASGQ